LLEIMNANETSVRSRIAAAEMVLCYEASEIAVERAKTFLLAVFESKQVSIDDRLEALKLARKAEARKVTQQSVRSTEVETNREVWRDAEIAARRMKLVRAGVWKVAVDRGDWADDLLTPDYIAPHDKSFSDLFED
jgi:hypothetical protein